MNKSKYLGFRNNCIIFCSIIISLLFISSATAVPQVNGSITINKVDEINKQNMLFNLYINNIDFDNLNSDETDIKNLYLLSRIIGLEIDMIDESKCNLENVVTISNDLEDFIINENDLIIETKGCIISLLNVINTIKDDKVFNNDEYESLNILNGFVKIINNIFTNKFYNNNDILKDNSLLIENGILQRLISLILTVLQFIVTILKAILQGFFTLFGGLIRTIGSIIGIIVLIFAELQTILLLTGLYMISLGVLSKNVIKTLTGIGAPIFAAISAFMTIAFGNLLGSLSTAIFSIVGVAIILAIPIALIAAFLYFSGYFDNDDGDGLFYIISSCFVYYIKSIN